MGSRKRRIYPYVILAVFILIGLFYWFFDAFMSYVFFSDNLRFMLYEVPNNFLDSLFYRASGYTLFIRITVLISAFVIGAIVMVLLLKRRSAEERLKKSEEMYRLLATNTIDCIWIMNFDLVFEYINPSIEQMLGYKADEWIGSKLSDHCDSKNFEIMEDNIRKAIDVLPKIKVVNFEADFLDKDGKRHSMEISGKILLDKNTGSPVHIQGVAREITESKKMQRALKRAKENLEKKVASRTKELMLVNKELESFAYSVSHDLRAPLRSIDGFSKAIEEDYGDRLDDTGKDFIRRVRRSAKYMSDMINEILVLSRVSRAKVKMEKIDISSLFKETFNELSNTYEKRDIKLVLEDDKICYGDRTLIKIILDNLITNSIKFTQIRKEAMIRFGAIEEDEGTIFFIEDNGTGFDMKYADKLFMPFQRLHSRKDYEGTGVGLATVKRVVSMHGGKIWAESELDHGTVFYFTLGNIEEKSER